MKRLTAAVAAVVGILVYLGLAVLGEGGFRPFVTNPPLTALAAITAILTFLATLTQMNTSSGVREDRANRWVILVIMILGLGAAYVAPLDDRIGFSTFGGDQVRWIGVAVYTVGGILRLAPVFVLGRRFSGLVAIQPGHTLVTTGLYGVIRHPSYLGLLLGALGWGLAFRSGAGVILALLNLVPIAARIRSEERLLASEFGADYDAYRKRTSRLVPGVW